MKKVRLSFLTILIFASFNFIFSAVVVIANKSVEQSEIPKIMLKAIYLGDITQWKNGNAVVPIVSNNKMAHELFLKSYVDKTPSNFEKDWKKIVFQGKGSMPLVFETDAEVIEYVNKTKGAIGYIDAGSLNDNTKALIIK